MTEVLEEKTTKLVNLTIDNLEITAPEGTLIVDAAKLAGIDIPVFCYHPKMEPVGMCRMCLVDVGMPMRDRDTGETIMEKGKPKIQFGRELQTGCTVSVSEGMVVVGYTEKVKKGRQDILEFLLSSHPLDCPICDKGGECPLQNLTIGYGSGESRFDLEEKQHLAKHVPLGDLIWLDRERCIQCARCTRFQDEIVDQPVIGFQNRGRKLQIVTFSEPGFDSYWSGNTSDICPVGALTTADFRFGARPWEMQASASVCNQGSVNCNITFNTRREAKSGGDLVIKRAMPRQNEEVNEVWLCDKGRFAYTSVKKDDRLTQPLIREGETLVETTWEKALDLVAEKAKEAGKEMVSLVGGRLSNEDYFNINQLTAHLGGKSLLNSEMAGGDLVSQVGLGTGSNIADMGQGDAILIVASDLEEEAPLFWLRVKQAAERGAEVIIANARETRADRFAKYKIRIAFGQETAVILSMAGAKEGIAVEFLADDAKVKAAAKVFSEANNAVIYYGSDGLGLSGSEELSKACAFLLSETKHTGRPNNGLVAVWNKANLQGAWDMGFRPSETLAADLKNAKFAYVVGNDPASKDILEKSLKDTDFVVVQDVRLSETAEIADVVLPAQVYTEREGTYTSAERRVQRFYPAVPAPEMTKPDYKITAKIAKRLDLSLEKIAASLVFLDLAEKVADYAELDYVRLAEVTEQWPIIGRDDLFYGGTSYQNTQGLGKQISPAIETETIKYEAFVPSVLSKKDEFLAVPVTTLYDRGSTMLSSEVLQPRIADPYVILNTADAEKLGVEAGVQISVKLNGKTANVTAKLDDSLAKGIVLVPRSMGIPISDPGSITIKAK